MYTEQKSRMESNVHTSWHDLDKNSLTHVLSFLEPKSLATVQLVCKDLREAGKVNLLWAPLLQRTYGLAVAQDKV